MHIITFLQLKHYNAYMFRPFLGLIEDVYKVICVCRCESSLTSHTRSHNGRYLIPGDARLFVVQL
jgi:hypothetical protein